MADLWTIPATAPYLWATNPGTRTTPTTGRKATGWIPGEPGSALQVNDLWGVSLDWVSVLAEIAPADGTIAAQVYQVYDTAGTPALASTIQASSNGGALIKGPTGDQDSRGIRFGYDSTDKLFLAHKVAPRAGGWTDHLTATGIPSNLITTGGVSFLNTGALGDAARRMPILLTAESAQSSGYPALVSLRSTFFTGAAPSPDLAVNLIEIDNATGAETILATIDRATPNIIIAGAGGYTTDPAAKQYCLELASPALNGTTTDGLGLLFLDIYWYANNPGI